MQECGLELPSPTERKFHQRTHKSGHVRCPHEGCIFVGTEQKTVDTHVRFLHTRAVCDVCGKEFSSQVRRNTWIKKRAVCRVI